MESHPLGQSLLLGVRAIDAAYLSMFLGQHKSIPFDMIVETMYETGKDLHSHYRETSEGGLAKKVIYIVYIWIYKRRK